MTRINWNGNLIFFIIITQRLIKLPERNPVPMRSSIHTFRIGIPIITVQFIIRVIVIEGRIHIQGIRTCRRRVLLNVNYIDALTILGFLILLCIPNRICFSPVTASVFLLVYRSITGIRIEAGFSSTRLRIWNRQSICSSGIHLSITIRIV